MNNMENNNTNNTVPTNAIPNQNNNVNQNVGVQPSGVNQEAVGVTATTSNMTGPNTVSNVNVNPISTDGGAGAASNAVSNEKLKKVEINYTPPSKAKTFFTFMMLILIIGFVVFLPEITAAVNQYKANKNAQKDAVITTGKLECDLTSNTTNLDITYLRVFKFTDSKLNEAEFTVTTRGDATLDEQTLNDMASKCSLLKTHTESISGVDINCTHSEGKLVEKQKFVYANLNMEDLDAAFTEAGGTYPEFENEQNIDTIEKNMNAAGYSCVRKK